MKALAGIMAYATDGLTNSEGASALLSLALGSYDRGNTRLSNLAGILGATDVDSVNEANAFIDLVRGKSSNICLNVVSQGKFVRASPSAVAAIGDALTDGRDANETTMAEIITASNQAVSQADAELVALMMITNGYSSNSSLQEAVPKAFSLALIGSGNMFVPPPS